MLKDRRLFTRKNLLYYREKQAVIPSVGKALNVLFGIMSEIRITLKSPESDLEEIKGQSKEIGPGSKRKCAGFKYNWSGSS